MNRVFIPPSDQAEEPAQRRGFYEMQTAHDVAAVGRAAATYHSLIRPRILRRGATDEELVRVLPGDEIAPQNSSRSAMATTVGASPEQIWPWLVQVGWSRGAFYSYNRIENLLGMDTHNADRVHPEWQNLKVGDTMWMSHPRLRYLFPETKAVRIDPNQALVFAIYGRPGGTDVPPSGVWSFVLERIDDKSTRLISRLRVNPPPAPRKTGHLRVHETCPFRHARRHVQRIERARPI